MSIALQNQVDELETKVQQLISQVQELTKNLKAVNTWRNTELGYKPKRKYTRHIQPQ